jgi:hypothetical protein
MNSFDIICILIKNLKNFVCDMHVQQLREFKITCIYIYVYADTHSLSKSNLKYSVCVVVHNSLNVD